MIPTSKTYRKIRASRNCSIPIPALTRLFPLKKESRRSVSPNAFPRPSRIASGGNRRRYGPFHPAQGAQEICSGGWRVVGENHLTPRERLGKTADFGPLRSCDRH